MSAVTEPSSEAAPADQRQRKLKFRSLDVVTDTVKDQLP
jgi:hypothetical protein